MELPQRGHGAPAAPLWSELRASSVAQAWKLSGAIIASVAVLTLGLLLSALVWDMRPSVLLRDPNALAAQPPYYGLVSTLGAALWLVAGASALLAWAATASSKAPARKILLSGGVLTVVVALDDLLMLHEGVFPRLGVPEVVVLAVYGALAAIFILRLAPGVFSTDWLLLAAGMSAFAASVLTDLFISSRMISTWTGQLILEDVIFKLSGILFWSCYFLRLSFSVLSARPSST